MKEKRINAAEAKKHRLKHPADAKKWIDNDDDFFDKIMSLRKHMPGVAKAKRKC